MALHSYTRRKIGPVGRAIELFNLSLIHRRTAHKAAQTLCEQFAAARRELYAIRGESISGLDVLEVGCGQRPISLILWSLENRAVGIDSEIVMRSFSITTAFEMLKTNGIVRAAKTVGRQVLRLDKLADHAIREAASIKQIPTLDVRLMDASAMSFADGSFDIVFSRAVFEHLSDPPAVVQEIRRVLRKGGTFYCLIHLYTSDSGCHDARVFRNGPNRPPSWSHLREKYKLLIRENTYLNRWSLKQWQETFAAAMPGSQVTPMCDDNSAERWAELKSLRGSGELANYSDEELLSPTLKVVWTKLA